VVLIVSLVLMAAPVDAEELRALPCRPTVACNADIVAPGVVELEAGYAARLVGGSWQHVLPFLLKLSVARWLQLQVGLGGNFVDSSRWFGDVVGVFKLHLADQDAVAPSVALSAAVSIPTAEAPGYVRAWDVFATLYVSRDFKWLHADLNLGVDYWTLDTVPRFQPWLALAFATELRHHLSPVLEFHLFGDATPTAPVESGLLAALAWSPRPWLVFDAGLDVSFVPSTRTLTLFAGLTMAPVALWHPRPPSR
jgi:hypothetical protein